MGGAGLKYVSRLRDISRFDTLVGRSGVCPEKLEVISNFVFLDPSRVEVLSLAEFVLILRLLGHAQDMEKRAAEQNSEQVEPDTAPDESSVDITQLGFASLSGGSPEVLRLTGDVQNSLTLFNPLANPRIVRTSPPSLVKFDGVHWDARTGKTKLLQPI